MADVRAEGTVPLWRRPRVRRGAAVLVLAAAVVWLLTPRAFGGYRDSPYLRVDEPVRSALPVLADAAAYPDREVEILWARPRVAEPSQRDSVELILCDGGPDGGVGGGAIPLDGICSDPRPPAGERYAPTDAPGPPMQLVLVVTGSGREEVAVDGVDLVYRDGVRFGYQHVGSRFVVPFDRP